MVLIPTKSGMPLDQQPTIELPIAVLRLVNLVQQLQYNETYFGPADITGHAWGVQNSVIVPYSMFI